MYLITEILNHIRKKNRLQSFLFNMLAFEVLILQHAVAHDCYCKTGVFNFIKTGSNKWKCCSSGFYRGV